MAMQRKSVAALALVAVLMTLQMTMLFVSAPQARADNVFCKLIPDPAQQKICELTTTNIPGVPDPSDVINNAAKSVLGPILQEFTQYEANAVAESLKKQSEYLNKSTVPSLTAKWFVVVYALVFGISIYVALGMFIPRITLGVKDQDAAEVVSSGGTLVLFLFFAGFIPALVAFLVRVSDNEVTTGFSALTGDGLEKSLKDIEQKLTSELALGPAVLLPLIILFLGVLGSVVVKLMLEFREAMLYAFTAAECLAAAMLVGGRLGVDMFKRITWGLIGLILFKPILAFTEYIGIGMIGGSKSGDAVVLGTVVCLVGPFLSWAAYKRIASHNINASGAFRSATRFAQMLRH